MRSDIARRLPEWASAPSQRGPVPRSLCGPNRSGFQVPRFGEPLEPARALAVRASGPYLGRVLSRIPSRLAARLWAALLVLTVAFHAVTPFEAPLVVRSGSAFSAATADVAIAPARKIAVERSVVQVAPVLPVVSAIVLPAMPLVAAIPHAWPEQTGPPLPAPLARKIAPRGPPTS